MMENATRVRWGKEWASDEWRIMKGVGSHGCSRLWARAADAFSPGREYSLAIIFARVDVGYDAFCRHGRALCG